MSYTFLLEQGEESSAECFSDIPASVLSKLNLTAEKSCSNDNETESCQCSPSGMTCEHSTASPGRDSLTLCAEDSHAKTSASSGKDQESEETKAGYGRKCGEWFARWHPDSCSWKIPQCLLFEDSEESLVTWPKWGLMRTGVCWERTMPELHIYESECGYWPTPDASGANMGESLESWTKRREIQKAKHRNGNGFGMPLAIAVKMYPTPAASDWKGQYKQSTIKRRSIESTRGVRLPEQLARNEGNSGELNPPFAEWLMGWPIEWTESQPLETARFQQWLDSHGKP